ncbi:hypothetical protein B0H14DRAFT_3165247 [Mycena olivaceomarginata]|nr:hypothetical protein B0H14DRAFT_3165247 [Mycena olivaceomarginata]
MTRWRATAALTRRGGRRHGGGHGMATKWAVGGTSKSDCGGLRRRHRSSKGAMRRKALDWFGEGLEAVECSANARRAREPADGVNACVDDGLMGPERAASGDCRRWTDAGGAGGCAMKPVDGVAQQWWHFGVRGGAGGRRVGARGALRGGRSGGGTERRQDRAGMAAHGMGGVDAGETGVRKRGWGVRSGGSRRHARGTGSGQGEYWGRA